MSGSGDKISSEFHDEPPAFEGARVEIPASLAMKLTTEQLDKLQKYANEMSSSSAGGGHKHSIKHIKKMEELMSKGKSFEDADKEARSSVGE